MDLLLFFFGDGEDLNSLQMISRAIVIFFIALIFLRIAGRRCFVMNAPFDNVILITLGAILSRAVVGASHFIPTLLASLAICVLHRSLGLLCIAYPVFGRFIKGEKLLLYKDGNFKKENLNHCLVQEEDIRATIRLKLNVDHLDPSQEIYMEGNGQISICNDKRKKEP